MSNKALIIVAHGSRKESSNAEVTLLGEKVKVLLGEHYFLVKTAFLEFTEPSLQACISACIDEEAKQIVILPYFLAPGNHVTRDIPEVVEMMKQHYPDVTIELREHIGSSDRMVQLLGDMSK